jgi:amidase
MAGRDPADTSTEKSAGREVADYAAALDIDALKGKKIGVARVFMDQNAEVDWLVEAALEAMREAGAETVDVEFPEWLMAARSKLYRAIRYPEFKAQIRDYLATLPETYPRDLDGLIAASMRLTAPNRDGMMPNPTRWSLMQKEGKASDLDGYEYRAVKEFGLPMVSATLAGLMETEGLDAIVYPTAGKPAQLIESDARADVAPGSDISPVTLANLSGFPDLILPIGFTGRGLPVTLSFLGPAFSEAALLGMGYALEQRMQARRLPRHTPVLASEELSY